MPRYQFPALIKPIEFDEPVRVIVAQPVDEYRSALEIYFPVITKNIQAMWGHPEINLYFSRLTIDDRGDREGFPKEVWEDLHMLELLHAAVFPKR